VRLFIPVFYKSMDNKKGSQVAREPFLFGLLSDKPIGYQSAYVTESPPDFPARIVCGVVYFF
jgi:hypothetical protein